MTIYRSLRDEMMAGGAVERDGDEPREPSRFTAAVAGIAVVVLLAWLGVTNIWSLVLVFGLLVSVFLHELGHFVTAGWAGMKRTQFFMGFGPKIWSFHRNGVEYGVRALPLGAFVRIVGMNNLDPVDEGDEDVAYSSKPYRWRLLVITAGSIMHVLLAVVIMLGVFVFGGRYQDTGEVKVIAVTSNTPASSIGIELGDVITAIDGQKVVDQREVYRAVGDHQPGDVIAVTFQRDDEVFTRDATLAARPDDANIGFLGVGTQSFSRVRENPFEAIPHVMSGLGDAVGNTFTGIFTVLNPANQWDQVTNTNADPTKRPTTVVGVTKVAGVVGEREGLWGVLEILAAVNIFVGLFNLVPLLPFDGGHAAIATYERIRSRKGRQYRADVEKMWPLTLVVLGLLVTLTITGLYLDVTRPF